MEVQSFYEFIRDKHVEGIDESRFDECTSIALHVDTDVKIPYNVRRPYYRMRGRSVTQEQALEIIGKTDDFFNSATREELQNCVPSTHFRNVLINDNYVPKNFGWCHRDGTLGINSVMSKYPTLAEILEEWGRYVLEFPYLNLIICVTHWDEIPTLMDKDPDAPFFGPEWDSVFFTNVDYGIYVHDRVVSIVPQQHAINLFQDYSRRFNKPRDVYEPSYYESYHVKQINYDDLVKMTAMHVEDPVAWLKSVVAESDYELRHTLCKIIETAL